MGHGEPFLIREFYNWQLAPSFAFDSIYPFVFIIGILK